eukprot:CAMPEP_0179201290 /NCGR_PEP_ID=MMETSP0796-20121207/100179_1 /TAXON_ID=73915 /ORGANISM="Pyrodinium bahamense, Strain pbaha01" /LENGTH=248 /DNA_ID=CAMNT_0020905847 /DNA_START=157 /DNA_END=903 /DNA_ORIENTATION=+
MVLDEGKGILTDESNDAEMKARIAHNLVLYGGVDHIRLKWNSNLEVRNNIVLTESGRTEPIPDGITAVNKRTPIPGLVVANNLVHSFAGSLPFDVGKHFDEQGSPDRLYNNYFSGGGSVRSALPGVTDLGANSSVLRDPANLDFRADGALPAGVGVDGAVLQGMLDLARDYSVTIAPSGWRHDHVRSIDTILESVPSEHLKGPTIKQSKKHKGYMAFWFEVVSEEYKNLCKCTQLELIPPKEYWLSRN